MPKVILTSRYIRDAPSAQLKNYVRYISTREGVEKIDESKRNLPATNNQKQLIHSLLRDQPHTKQMLEYEDFCLHPTIGNATEFISCALEQNVDLIGKRQNYVDYIANRPRAERIGEHGLFTDAGQAVVISEVQEEVANHKGPVWTHVISLRRKDAARLGYDSGEQWRDLLRSKRAMLCKHMKIDSANLRWYAAYHNESHHPHVHLMVYSSKENDGFLTEKSIAAMRSELAHDIFRQDFAHLYEEQNQARAVLKREAEKVLEELICQMKNCVCKNLVIGDQMVELSCRLRNTGGKKVYGYLKRDVKAMVDQIVDALAKEPPLVDLYQAWNDWQNEILKTYQNQLPPLLPLSKQPQFKSIKNMVITEAMKLGDHHFTFEDEMTAELLESPEESGDELEEEWKQPYLQHQTGQRLHMETGTEKNDEAAEKYWERFAKLGNVNAQYALGKLRLEKGMEDPQKAVEWITKAAEGKNAAAQYALGKLYLCGHGVPRDEEKGILFLEASAAQGNMYAQFLLDYLDSFRAPSVLLAATRLMHRLGNIFWEEYQKEKGGSPFHIDRKRRRRLQEKKRAQGHAYSDHEQQMHN